MAKYRSQWFLVRATTASRKGENGFELTDCAVTGKCDSGLIEPEHGIRWMRRSGIYG